MVQSGAKLKIAMFLPRSPTKFSKKLDKILHSIKVLTKRVNDLDKSVLRIGNLLDNLEVKIKTKFDEIEQQLTTKTETNEVKLIQKNLKIEKTIIEKD